MDDYLKLDQPTPPTPQVASRWAAPTEMPQSSNEYIISQVPGTSPPGPQTNWLKTGFILVALFVVLGGTGSVVYVIKNTTDSYSKAAEKQNSAVQEVLDDIENDSLSLVPKVQAGYEDPFEPTSQEANPFAETKNPFDEIGY